MSLFVRTVRRAAKWLAIMIFELRLVAFVLVIATVSSSTIAMSSHIAAASGILSDRSKAAVLFRQIQSIGGRVEALGQQYDLNQLTLRKIDNRIKNSKRIVTQIELGLTKGNLQLRQDVVFAYVTNGSAAKSNPLFSHDPLTVDAINIYSRLAEGNISATLASLKNYKIRLTKERANLYRQDRQAIDQTRKAANAFHEAKVLQATLGHALSQVKGRIADFVAQQEAAAAAQSAAQSAATLQAAAPVQGFAAPPPSSRANVAIRAALSLIGVPYAWGGASRSGVDCSGLVLLAYAVAGVSLPHYSGSQYADTERVPLWNIQPGDLLFYGPNGSEHEAMYLGNGKMIEASSTGTLVHISPIRLGYGFIGLGRVRT
ncbi:MAG: C40 family peptidase [Acidobacteria bacterium]|nr:C40 family peptidase [Acidobacteriota bacterium]